MTDYCENCGRTEGVRTLEVVNPRGEVDVCEECVDDLRATVVQEVDSDGEESFQQEYETIEELYEALMYGFVDLRERFEVDDALEHADFEVTVEPDRVHIICNQPEDAPEFEDEYGTTEPVSLVHDLFVDAAREAGRRLESDVPLCEEDQLVGYVPLEPNGLEGSA